MKVKDTHLLLLWIYCHVMEGIQSEVATPASPLQDLVVDFYKPGNGIMIEGWMSENAYDFENFGSIPDFPTCPFIAINGADFENQLGSRLLHQYWQYRAIFASNQTGPHSFFALCKKKCQVSIHLLPDGWKKILEVNVTTSNDWNERKWAADVTLLKGFRYEILVYHYGSQNENTFFSLGVRLPDSTEMKPIASQLLHRSMEHYKWSGLLVQWYTIKNLELPREDSLDHAYRNNPAFPNSPQAFSCKSSLFGLGQFKGNNYGLLHVGYLRVPLTEEYSFTIHVCDNLCELFLTMDNDTISIGKFILHWDVGPVSGSKFVLSANVSYPIKLFFADQIGSEMLKIEYNLQNKSFSSWKGLLYNIVPDEAAKNVPDPVLSPFNSTTVLVSLKSQPYLPRKDNWTYSSKLDVLIYRQGYESLETKIVVHEPLPVTLTITGLRSSTMFRVYVHYYGKSNGMEQNLISRSATVSTEAGVNSVKEEVPVMFFTETLFSGKALFGHAVEVFSVTSVEVCFTHCLQSLVQGNGCSSFNYWKSGTGEKRLCEINRESHMTFLKDFNVAEDSQYYLVT